VRFKKLIKRPSQIDCSVRISRPHCNNYDQAIIAGGLGPAETFGMGTISIVVMRISCRGRKWFGLHGNFSVEPDSKFTPLALCRR
jgi:hypothetical protein